MSMLSNNQLKWVRSLHQKKFREEEGCFLAEGYKVVEEALQTGMTVSLIAGTPEFLHRMKSHPAASAGIEFVECTRQQLDRMSSLSTAPDGLAVIRKPATSHDEVVPSDHLVLVLDGIRDPGNLGTILRIADWFGLPSLVVSEDTVEEFNPKGRASGDGIALQNQDPSHKAGYLSCGIHRRNRSSGTRGNDGWTGLIQKPVSEKCLPGIGK